VLSSLAVAGEVKESDVAEAIERYALDAEAPEPRST
jgi:pyruvate dehydrogenase complex dehydrogenase (E1) component